MPGRADNRHAGLARDVPEKQHVATDTDIRPVDEQIDALSSENLDVHDDQLRHSAPVHMHVARVCRPEEVDKKVLVRERPLDLRAVDGTRDGLEQDAGRRRRPGLCVCRRPIIHGGMRRAQRSQEPKQDPHRRRFPRRAAERRAG
jgi:hypothetical protein